jgi:hypothetical protein
MVGKQVYITDGEQNCQRKWRDFIIVILNIRVLLPESQLYY